MSNFLYVLCGFAIFFAIISSSIALVKFFGETQKIVQGIAATVVSCILIGLSILCCYLAERDKANDEEEIPQTEITIFDEKKTAQKQESPNTVTIIQYDTVYNDHIDTCDEFWILQGALAPFFYKFKYGLFFKISTYNIDFPCHG